MPEPSRVNLFRLLGASDPEKLAAMPEEAAVEELIERRMNAAGVFRAPPIHPWPRIFRPFAVWWYRFRVWLIDRRMRRIFARIPWRAAP